MYEKDENTNYLNDMILSDWIVYTLYNFYLRIVHEKKEIKKYKSFIWLCVRFMKTLYTVIYINDVEIPYFTYANVHTNYFQNWSVIWLNFSFKFHLHYHPWTCQILSSIKLFPHKKKNILLLSTWLSGDDFH